jgi:hypothetical protein
MMDFIIKLVTQYPLDTVVLVLLLTGALYISKIGLEQIIKKASDEQIKKLEFYLARHASFIDRVLLDRYTLIRDIQNKLEIVNVNLDRYRKNPNTYQLPKIDDETILITEIQTDLRVNKAILTDEYYDLLQKRFDIMRTFWKQEEYDLQYKK